jgi:tetratricopeptide (TPR) repeat protein
MTKDNALYIMIGLLAGFISGYFVHEVVAARQPPRLGNPSAMAGAGPTAAAPGAATPPAGAPMEEIARLRQHVDENPEDADAILVLANLNYDIRAWETAAELYSRYLELRPEEPDVLTDLGTTLRNQGRFEEALLRFDRAQALDESHWQSLYNQVVVYAFDLEQMERARELLVRLQSLQPANPEVDRLAQEVERRAEGVEATS